MTSVPTSPATHEDDDGLPPLTLEALITAALDIADTDGLDAVTIRRVASTVGASPMSLYRFVTGKEQLLDLMVDQVLSPLPLLDADAPWAAEARRYFRAFYDLLMRSPAAAHHLIDQQTRGPQMLRSGETLLACLRGNGISPELAAEMTIVLSMFTLGGALSTAPGRRVEYVADDQPADVLPFTDAFLATVTPELRRTYFERGFENLIAGYERAVRAEAKSSRRKAG